MTPQMTGNLLVERKKPMIKENLPKVTLVYGTRVKNGNDNYLNEIIACDSQLK